MKYEHESIDQAMSQLDGLVGQLDAERGDMKSRIDALNADWEGSASDEMHVAFQKIDKDISNLKEIMMHLHSTVRTGNNDMQGLDKQLAGGWGGL